MGELYFFNLAVLMQQYNAKVFFETGTGYGFGVAHARTFPFDLIVSTEIVEQEAKRMQQAFRGNSHVRIFHGHSVSVMRQVLPQIKDNIIFWLDVHYPGAHHNLYTYDAMKDERIRLPLQEELEVIRDLRPNNRDVILIDDLRIYEKDNFQEGNLPEGVPGGADSKFLYTTFAATHEPHRFLQNTGYFALLPKQPATVDTTK